MSSTSDSLWGQAGIALLTLLGSAGALMLLLRGITEPLISLSKVMKRLSGGALETEVPNQNRPDEIGEMSRAVQYFKQSVQQASNLQQDADANRNHGGATAPCPRTGGAGAHAGP